MIPPVHVVALEVQGLDVEGNEMTLDCWFFRAFELTEQLSEPFSLMLELATDDLDLYVPGLVGGRCLFRFGRGDFDRDIKGIVIKTETIGVVHHRLHVRLWVSPAFEALGLSRRRRVFVDMTAVEIVEAMTKPVFERYGGTLDVSALEDARLRTRDYCVQMDETDLQLAQRLLAEEGIAFSFRHGGDAEALVLMPMTAILHSASGEDDVVPRTVKLRSRNHDTAPEETIRNLQGSTRMRPNQTEVSMWDWKSATPTTIGGRQDPFADDANAPKSLAHFGEIFEHERCRPVEEEEGAPLFDNVEGESNLLAHRSRLDDVRATGLGNVVGFTDGATFELTEHPTRDLDGSYAVLSVYHRAEFDEIDEVGTVGQAGSYSNRFSCFRFANADGEDLHTFAPARRHKPLAPGPVTATVVGPEGEEIYTDEHGRIKVRMHWDREGLARGDHETSCWVPVGQIWAGPGYGAVFIPRVGMEVVIAFLAGDPDRPICTGVVYNGLNTPPYPLPDSKTRSVIKTSSSPGGDGYNELSFEDAAGSEEVHLHAQKNLREVVKSCHTTSVGVDQSLSVGRNRTKTVDGHETVTVSEFQAMTIGGARSLVVKGPDETTIHCGAATGQDSPPMWTGRSVLIVHGERQVAADDAIQLQVGPVVDGETRMRITPEGVLIQAKEFFRVEVGGTVYELTPAMAETKSDTVKLTAKDSAVEMDSEIRANAKDAIQLEKADSCFLKLDGDATLKGADVEVGAAGETKVHGMTAIIEAAKRAAMSTPGTSFTAEPSAAKVSSAKIESSAVGVQELKGALIKIN